MSILIKGMEMPKNGCATIIIMSNGTVYRTGDLKELGTSVPVPPHGDLIGRDALLVAYDAEHQGPPGRARLLIEAAPTIIPAENEGE